MNECFSVRLKFFFIYIMRFDSFVDGQFLLPRGQRFDYENIHKIFNEVGIKKLRFCLTLYQYTIQEQKKQQYSFHPGAFGMEATFLSKFYL